MKLARRSYVESSVMDSIVCIFLTVGGYTAPGKKEMAVLTTERHHYGDPNPNDATKPPTQIAFRNSAVKVLSADLEILAELPLTHSP